MRPKLALKRKTNSEGLVLVTNNMGEFARVPALEAETWVQTAQ